MKFAISIQDSIFREVEAAAKELHCSRSEIFAIAVKDFLERQKSRKLLDALNEAYSDTETQEEEIVRKASKRRYVRSIKEKY